MAEFIDLIEQQNKNAAELQTAITNYKKSPKDRLTESYIKEYMSKIDGLWTKFQNLDRRLCSELPENHGYFEKGYYKLLGAKYNEVHTNMEGELLSIRKRVAEPTASNSLTASNTLPKAAQRIVDKISIEYKQQKLITNIQMLLHETLSSPTRSTQFYTLKLKTIDQNWKNVYTLHESLLSSSESYDLDKFFAIEEEINEGILKLQELVEYNEQNLHEAAVTTTSKNVKLPTIELPKFNGTVLQWRQFRDLFIELVHRQSIPKCQKMWYLKTSLLGEAERLIKHLAATAENYDTAWQILEDRFENHRLLTNTIICRLVSQPTASNDNSVSLKNLHDTTQECLLSLKNLGINTQDWGPMLLYLLVQKLNKNTHALWEQTLTDPKKIPSIEEFLGFLKLRFQSLESIGARVATSSNEIAKTNTMYRSLSVTIGGTNQCIMCHNDHALYKCPDFLKLAPNQRLPIVQRAKRCVNCFKQGHAAKTCRSGSCHKCQKKHNSLLHLESVKPPVSSPSVQAATTSSPPVALTTMQGMMSGTRALLSTILLSVKNKYGNAVQCRAVLDSGSQLNLISSKFVNKLGFTKGSFSIDIEGIGQAQKFTDGRLCIEIKSYTTNFVSVIEAHVLPKIVSEQPTRHIDIGKWNVPKNIQLADPKFHEPGSIDLLLGAGIFYSILSVGQIALGDGLPRLQNSLFGWIVGGEYASTDATVVCGICTQDVELTNIVERFWQIEDNTPSVKPLTAAEQRCETFFASNIRRSADGHYVVKLPFRQQQEQLGQSREIALQRFKAVERKILKDPRLRSQYVDFMREYNDLGHMVKINSNDIPDKHYFLPHHAVLKPESTTTKLRVVFDASAKTSTNVSLNDILDKGPTIQDDMFTILMRFRLYRYVFTADIEKMYRQIWIDEQDRNMQLIWWREDIDKPIDCYQLKTVTYGTSSAPYLAIRTLREVASDNKTKLPLASMAIEKNFYVDDVLSGEDSLPMALEIQKQLIKALKASGLNLRKWCANHPRLLENIHPKDREVELSLNKDDETIKTMGLKWYPATDDFRIQIKQKSDDIRSTRHTKRSILSETAQIFDPLGFIAPVTVTAKIILQKLWLLKLDWDAAIPQELHQQWNDYKAQINELNTITVPRHIFGHQSAIKPQLHIFTDASEKAYGAVAYMRTTQAGNLNLVRLVCAKSRIAPVKQITLPRLELCAAKLGVELLQKLLEVEAFKNYEVFCWTDSTAVLGWINSESSNYHTFIANRVSFIHQNISPQHWRHVRTQDNPADLISRGLTPEKLINNNFWFYGPKFLHGSVSCWPLQPPRGSCELERRKAVVGATTVAASRNLLDEVNHKNSFNHLQRVVAYMRRICKPKKDRPTDKNLQPNELEDALRTIVKLVQSNSFADELADLTKHKSVNNSSPLSSLNAFIDDDNIIRVGGRLEHSNLSYDSKHQMILPYHHPVTKLFIEKVHKENLHAGAQTVMSIVRQRFWPLKLKMLARTVVQNCVKCVRARPQLLQQLMGNLPADRVQPSRPFVISGVDFFGPLWTHFRLRGKRPAKAYVAVFCCFATKAVHMELVNDLTTEAFIGALKRFVARRGHCAKLYCDNATNFVGAKNYMQELHEIIHSDAAQVKLQNECSKRGLQFAFIPPRAPHFGGLWEAAVKSAKRLLLGTLSSTSLTYEEMETLVVEAEAILNSRPLTPISSDANDLQALTPGHFLVGEPLTAIVDPRATPNNSKGVTRWKLINHLKAEFWQRWMSEYLCNLQYRHKWKKELKNVQPGTMVVIKEDNLPVLRWPLGRIIKAIPGTDGLVRVADVRTATSICRRPIHRLAPLPVEPDDKNELLVHATSDRDIKVSDHPIPTKRSRLAQTPTMLSIFIICLLLPLCLGSPIETQPFATNPGIYFERLGAAEIQSSEWNLISYVDMQLYWEKFNIISKYPAALRRAATESRSLHSKPILNLVEGLLEEISVQNQLLQPTKNPRIKRGAFNVVGNVANALFGVLDSTYAEEAERTIAHIKQNEDQLLHQIRNQTSFLDATINILKREQIKVHDDLNEMAKVINRIQNQQTMAESVAELAVQATLDMLHLERIQDSLIDILVSSHHGRISPELISPKQLQIELNTVKANLPNDLRLPASTEDPLNFYKLMKIEGRATQGYIIFKITIPLIATEQFEVLKLIPVPWLSNGKFLKIHSTYAFMLINLHRDQYLPLEEKELSSCTLVNNEVYLCHPHQPLQKLGSITALCEVQLLSQGYNKSSCHVEPASPGPHWIQLHNPNLWIYSVNQEYMVNVVCKSVPSQLKLQYAGILTLRADCSIKQPVITIQGYKRFEASRHKFYIPTSDIEEIVNHPTNHSMSLQSLSSSTVQELEDVQKKLSALRIELPNKLSPHDIHHYTMTYMSLIVLIVLSCYIAYKFRSCRRAQQAESTPNQFYRRTDNQLGIEDNKPDDAIITISC